MTEFAKRLGRRDLLAAMPSGLYVFLCLYAVSQGAPSSAEFSVLWHTFRPGIKEASGQPILLGLALFGAYLFGTALRSVRVSWVEWPFPFDSERFPYPRRLKNMNNVLAKEKLLPRQDFEWAKDQVRATTIFNHWKDRLRIDAPHIFEYYVEFELRSRFAAAMVLATLIGVTIAAILFVSATQPNDILLALELGILSAVLVVVFWTQLRRVRRQEVYRLYSLTETWLNERPPNKRLQATQ